jgi:hypothetical protein
VAFHKQAQVYHHTIAYLSSLYDYRPADAGFYYYYRPADAGFNAIFLNQQLSLDSSLRAPPNILLFES